MLVKLKLIKSVHPDTSTCSVVNARLASHSVRPELVEGLERLAKLKDFMKYVLVSLFLVSQLLAMEPGEDKKLTTIRTLAEKDENFLNNAVGKIYVTPFKGVGYRGISLTSSGLDALDGIEKIAEDKYISRKIRTINLDDNNLHELDVKRLLDLFPYVEKIKANNNHIQKLIMPKQLPREFQLLLKNNKLQKIPNFRCLGNGTFDFEQNNLSQEQIKTLKKRLQLSLLAKNKHYAEVIANQSIDFTGYFVPSCAKTVACLSPIVVADCLLHNYVDPYYLSWVILSFSALKGLFDGCMNFNPVWQWYHAPLPNTLSTDDQKKKGA